MLNHNSTRNKTGKSLVKSLYLKVMPVTFLLVRFLSLKESTCHTRKNIFYFTSQALFVVEKIKF